MTDVRILMACLDGAPHLPAQLASIKAQTIPRWSLDASDDGSRDSTVAILRNFAGARVFPGPQRGVAAAFLSLAERAARDVPDHALAFCDQDDVWFPEKLERAMSWMERAGDPRRDVLIYASRTVLTDSKLNRRGLSHLHPRLPDFRNALVQNVLGGNTVVVSPAAGQILARSVPAALHAGVPYHDWWAYLVLSGAGAAIFNDPHPGLLYRQHGSNQLGHHDAIFGRLRRARFILRREYAQWITANLVALSKVQDLLTDKNRDVFKQFMSARELGGADFAESLKRIGIYRQTRRGDHMLRIMARMKWL